MTRNKITYDTYEELKEENAELLGVIEKYKARIVELEQQLKCYKEALTPSIETKKAYSSEFAFMEQVSDEEGDFHTHERVVPWITVKEIMRSIMLKAEATLEVK